MTIKELKAELENYPDNYNVAVAMPNEEGTIIVNDLNMISESHMDDEIVLEFNLEVQKFHEVAARNSKELEKMEKCDACGNINTKRGERCLTCDEIGAIEAN
jgi:hypothetical protein